MFSLMSFVSKCIPTKYNQECTLDTVYYCTTLMGTQMFTEKGTVKFLRHIQPIKNNQTRQYSSIIRGWCMGTGRPLEFTGVSARLAESVSSNFKETLSQKKLYIYSIGHRTEENSRRQPLASTSTTYSRYTTLCPHGFSPAHFR